MNADMLSVDEARSRVLAAVAPMPTVELLLADAHSYVVAQDLFATHPLPRFDNSAMDGYAVVASDLSDASQESPAVLEVIGEIRAGDSGQLEVRPGRAARIMTGAPLPRGADAVIQVEETEETDRRVSVRASLSPGTNVRPAGDDLKEGDPLVQRGAELGPGELALLASYGYSPVTVHRRPKVAVLVTGDELVAPETEPGPGQIRDSNSVALGALVREAGGELVPLGNVPDTREAVVDTLQRAAELADLVVSSGGVAVGKYDFVKEAVEALGGIDLWRVAMQPGKPVVLGRIGDTPFLGLPGNPVSIHIGFEQFVRPAIRKMRGCGMLFRPTITATLTERIEKRPGRLHFVRVRLTPDDDGWRATPTGPQGSHIQSSLIDCHGVARFPRDESVLDAGTPVVVEVWDLPGSGEE